MNSHADKTNESKGQAVANTVQQHNSSPEAHIPEALAQTQLQTMANNSIQVNQLRGLQNMADNSSRVKHTAQLQATMHSVFPAQKQAIEEEPLYQKKENNTGLPDALKSGVENLSGMSLDDVKVHYNSNKPAQLQAHAYAQGTDIHVASGQEKHLPHEAWHVVQQKQGRVQPTIQMKGNINVNDDANLEKEADVMGEKALQMKDANLKKSNIDSQPDTKEHIQTLNTPTLQAYGIIQRAVKIGPLPDSKGDSVMYWYTTEEEMFDAAFEEAGANALSIGNLVKMAIDGKVHHFANWNEAFEATEHQMPNYQSNGYWYDPESEQYYLGPPDASLDELRKTEAPDRIYLVGEGDFSFALSIAKKWQGQPVIIMATAYETEQDVMRRGAARNNVLALKELGVRVQFQVDATKLDEEPVSPRQVDKIGFVFPHAGGGGGDSKAKDEYVLANEPLLKNFLASSRAKLVKGGTAFIVMKETEPYSLLTKKFPEYAVEFGYSNLQKRGFVGPDDYKHVYTGRSKAVKGDEHASLFIFTK